MGAAAAVAAVGVVGSVAGSAISSSNSASAAKSAANTQAASDAAARQQQQAQFEQTQTNLAPWISTGTNALGLLYNSAGVGTDDPASSPLLRGTPYSAPTATAMDPFRGDYQANTPNWDPSEAGLEATPGYQFSLDQGLKGVQNSYAAKGLGSSGAALKGAADYAQGLAQNTYQQQFSNYNTQFQNVLNLNAQDLNNYNTLFNENQTAFQNKFTNYLNQTNQFYSHQLQDANILQNLAGSGQNAAAGLGALGQTNANAQSNLIAAQGASQAAGTVGAANATNQGISNATGALSQGAQLYGLQQSGLLGAQAQVDPYSTAGYNPANTNTAYQDYAMQFPTG